MASGPAFEAFLWSLTQQESGGNYRAVGPPTKYGRAYGRYQVLAPNVGPWTAKHYGRRLTPQQFLNNPRAQDAVVRGVLGGYYDRYGARGAASMWYSGQPNWRKSYGNPPVYRYVDSVISRASRFPGGSATQDSGSATGGVSPFQVEAAVPRLTDSERAEQYGLSMRLINSNRELKNLFKKAVAGSWSPQRFAAALRNTGWWRTQPKELRQYITLKHTDPATWTQNRRAAAAKLNSLAVQVGLGSQITAKGTPTRLLDSAMYYSLALGWSDQRMKDWFGARVNLNGDFVGGEAGEVWDTLHELTYLNGLKFSNTWMKHNTRSVIAGKSTLQTLEGYIRKTAAARYGSYAEQIRAGMNVMDLAAPYIKATAGILELAEGDIDLFNPHIAKAMTAKQGIDVPAGMGAQMPLWQFENALREDPLWKKTNNARESMMTVARQVAKDFGMAY